MLRRFAYVWHDLIFSTSTRNAGKSPMDADADVDEENEEEESLPEYRPDFLSPSAFSQVRAYFNGSKGIAYDPGWMSAYFQPAGYFDSFKAYHESLEAERMRRAKADKVFTADGSYVDVIGEEPRVPSWYRVVNEWVFWNQITVNSEWFSSLIIFCIILAGILVGVQRYYSGILRNSLLSLLYPRFLSLPIDGSIASSLLVDLLVVFDIQCLFLFFLSHSGSYPAMEGDPVLLVLDSIIQIIFTLECVLKIFAEGREPLRFFYGPQRSWNNFDLWLVASSWLPGGAVGNVAFLRLLRLMRLLKLVGKIKELQLIVMGLANGLNSVQYILVLMLLIFYLFAVLGVGSFQKNDPFHFGSLGQAMLTLFRCATLEDWSDVMYINFYGCDGQQFQVNGVYSGLDGAPPYEQLGHRGTGIGTGYGYFFLPVCWKPIAQPAFSTFYFISFVVIAAFVMLSLFIGAVCGGMSDAMGSFKDGEKIDKAMKEAREQERLGEIEAAEDEAAALANKKQAEEQVPLDMGDAHLEATNSCSLNLHDVAKGVAATTAINERAYKAQHTAKLLKSLDRARAEIVVRYDFAKITNPLFRQYLKLAVFMDGVAKHPYFVNLITVTILAAGVVVGFQTELAKPGSDQARLPEDKDMPTIEALGVCDDIILAIFTLDVVVKLIAEGHRPLHYFDDGWNCFDFFIVAAAFIFMLPFMPDLSSMLAMLRLLRLLRVLKLVKALPQLRIIIEALISGFGSIFFVMMILFMFFYLYANVGMMFFAKNDPAHFGCLQYALLTLFRCATMDDWSDIMYISMLGCDKTVYKYGRAYDTMANKGPSQKALEGRVGHEDEIYVAGARNNCNQPEATGWIAVIYIVSFVVVGSLVLITLFIGVVATAMEETKGVQKQEVAEEFQNLSTAKNLGWMPTTAVKQPIRMELLHEIFTSLDINGNNVLDNDDMKPVLSLLPLIRRGKEARAIIAKMDQDEVNIAWLRSSDRDQKQTGLNDKLASVEKLANFEMARSSFPDTTADPESGSSISSSDNSASGNPHEDLKRHSLELYQLMVSGEQDPDCPTSDDIDIILHVLDEYYRNVWSFLEFMVVVDFMHRVEDDVTLLRTVRTLNPFTSDELTSTGHVGGTFGIRSNSGRDLRAATGADDVERKGNREDRISFEEEGGKARTSGRNRSISADRMPLDPGAAGGSTTSATSSGTQSPRSKGSRSRESSREKNNNGMRSNGKGRSSSSDVKGSSPELTEAHAKSAEMEATNKQLQEELAALKSELRSKKAPARAFSTRSRGEATPHQRL